MFWVIDRFEGTKAVCTNDAKETRDIPKGSLPPGLKEGDTLREHDGHYERDDAETIRRRKDVNDLVKGMWA